MITCNDAYELFIQTKKNEAKTKANKIHEYYITTNNIFEDLKVQEKYLKFINITLDQLWEFRMTNSIKLYEYIKDQVLTLVMTSKLRADIKAFIDIIAIKIPILKRDISKLRLVINMPYPAYYDILKAINTEIVAELLRGNPYNFPNSVGRLHICNVERNFNTKSVNYLETDKLRKKGVKDYIVYRTDSHYPIPLYIKKFAKVANYKYYTYRMPNFIHTPNTLNSDFDHITDIEEVINIPKLGSYKKLIHINNFKAYTKYNELYKRKASNS